MRSAINELLDDGFLVRVPMYLAVLAEALLKVGRSDDAHESIERALTLQRQTKENWCRPELLRVKADILGALGKRDRAQAALGEARKDAIMLGARTLELRIVNDMAHTAISCGDHVRAAELLLPVYEGFKNRTATEDLERCARLLVEAAPSRIAIQSQA